jgi:hypothetical protein
VIIASGGAGGGGRSALFAPTPRKINGLSDSPLLSPSASIACMQGKSKISPIKAVTSGKGWDATDLDEEDEDEDEEERLSRELGDALEQLDAPSSSLPIASSDFDTELPPATSSSGEHLSASEEDETMRYWSTGLPPSSPPPPTSPVLPSQMDDEDMDDIGNAMQPSLSKLANVVGFFTNILPVKTNIDVDQTFSQYLDAFKADLMKSFGNGDVAYEEILSQDKDRSPFSGYFVHVFKFGGMNLSGRY